MTGVPLWFYRLLFAAFALLAIAIPLLPLGFLASRLAMPDLFFALTIAWVVRSPKTAPLVLVALLAILADAVLSRPVGLWALLILILSELTRMNDRLIRDTGFIAEWLYFGAILTIMVILQNTVLFLTFAGAYPFNRLVQIVMLSMFWYPFIAGFLHYILRVRGPVSRNLPDRLGKVG